jgi:hypothetical protein
MHQQFLKLGSIAILGLWISTAVGAEDFQPDPEGYIRHWVMLAPIALPEGQSGADAILRDQIRGEARLQPKAGDPVKVGGKDLTWQHITASTNYVDFNAILKSMHDRAAGYLVTYIVCDRDRPDVILSVASNDQGRIYFNGVDIYAYTDARTLMLNEPDRGRITLKKGVNVMVFKIINEQNSWQGAMRLLDTSGAPLKDIQIKREP